MIASRRNLPGLVRTARLALIASPETAHTVRRHASTADLTAPARQVADAIALSGGAPHERTEHG